ncbi:hypothetical protein SEA_PHRAPPUCCINO_42 [Mycobacterium phage Phrappuccino]|uniref:Uncharacterized protein n=1 Tax=Mycobacterium phage Phrappuccino TaxID=2591223 RepID=A0A514DDN3_9CAUD|nr:excisionase [Mycobacterium phage Phrappuccino]QDH91719.1 hypothetical protein SEA_PHRAPPUCCINO_42 [Mycobacterium phage Phrappuccino]QIQ63162.1 hypothetical protein SEA_SETTECANDELA_42 [Mycobacterium phage Settecandela]
MSPLTYSLTEVAQAICGDDLGDPEAWVKRKILDGTFGAIKVGRSYRMTHDQFMAALATLEVRVTPRQAPATTGLTASSARRRRKLQS